MNIGAFGSIKEWNMMKRLIALGIALCILSVASAQAVTPRSWELLRLEQFLKGKFDGISVSYSGAMSLAPREVVWQGPLEEFYLSALRDRDGNLFLGTGHSGNIYKIDREGNPELYFHTPEMDVYCLAQDSRGHLYAGTSPNGKIYKITAPKAGEPFFDPEERYIWDLEFMNDDILLAAVGESGAVYTISPQGDGSEWLKAKENHILCLTKTDQGEILAGSGGKGRLYRLARGKAPAILYESPFEEIRAIVLDDQEAIFLAAGGRIARPGSKAPEKPASGAGGAVAATDVAITVTPEGVAPSEPETGGLKQPGALFRIGSDGIAKKIWSSEEDIIYTLLWDDSRRRIIFGTGNRGRIYAAGRDEKVSLLLQKESEQIFGLMRGGAQIYSLANNPPELSLLYPDQRDRGEYTSEVFDAGLRSSWGRIEWDATVPRGATLQLQTRSGNSDQPSSTWSNWSPPYGNSPGEQILNPAARYIQFKILFKTDSGRSSPEIRKVALFYLQANVAPVISMFEVLPVNTIFLESPPQDSPILGLNPGPAAKAAAQKGTTSSMLMAKKTERKGYQTVIWEARDENGDHLLYDLSFKERGGERWRLLKSAITQKVFAFETLTLPDGEYELKLEAHDGPSNPSGRELRTEKTSRPFVIDNSLPVIEGFQATRSGSRLSLEFTARDSFSRIKEVRYLVRPDEWRIIFPEDGICDNRQERFEVSVTLPSGADNMVTVKVVDEHGNVGVHRSEF
jgi:hypothetical protein